MSSAQASLRPAPGSRSPWQSLASHAASGTLPQLPACSATPCRARDRTGGPCGAARAAAPRMPSARPPFAPHQNPAPGGAAARLLRARGGGGGRALHTGSVSSTDLYASMTTRTRWPRPAAGQRGMTTTYLRARPTR